MVEGAVLASLTPCCTPPSSTGAQAVGGRSRGTQEGKDPSNGPMLALCRCTVPVPTSALWDSVCSWGHGILLMLSTEPGCPHPGALGCHL